MQTFAGLRDSSLPKTRSSTCSSMEPSNSPVLFSVWKNNLTPIPFALAVLNIVTIFKLWKLITLTHNVFHLDAVALRQQRSRISTITLTLIVIMTIDRPRRQCSRSSIRQSPRSVSTTFSVARRPTGATLTTHIDAYTYNDYRSALQAVFSVIYMSVIVTSQYGSSE